MQGLWWEILADMGERTTATTTMVLLVHQSQIMDDVCRKLHREQMAEEARRPGAHLREAKYVP